MVKEEKENNQTAGVDDSVKAESNIEIKIKPSEVTKKGIYIQGKLVKFIAAQPISNKKVDWDNEQFLRGDKTYKPLADGFPDNSSYVQVIYKDFGGQMKNGFVVKTPQEVMLWTFEGERA